MNSLLVAGISLALLLVISFNVATAQVDEVTVPAINGTPVEVPTVEQAAENFTYSIGALITAIIAILTVVIKSGVLDTILSKTQKKRILDGAEATRVALTKALENKLLIRKSYEIAFASAPPEKKEEYRILIQNLDAQITATIDQIQYYTDRFPQVNPDANRALPRESHNIATKKLIHEDWSREHGSVL